MYAIIGSRLKQARENKGFSQSELARILGYKSRSSVNKMESGERAIPRKKVLETAKILEVRPAFLMGWEDSEPADTKG